MLCLHKDEKGEISVLSDESCLDIKPPHILDNACHHDGGESGSAESGFLEDHDMSSSGADISGSAR